MPLLGSIIKKAISIRSKLPNRKNANKQQLRQLKKLISRAKNTDFGKRYNFIEMYLSKNPINYFQENVPIYDYQTIFDEWWHRVLKGEKNICWPGKIKYFALSSGTSESSSKHIPVSKSMIKAIHKGSIKQILSTKYFNFSKEQYQTQILFVGGSTNLNFNGTYFSGDLSGITTGTQPNWIRNFTLPGPEIRSQNNWEAKLNDIVLNASKWNIGFICGVPAWIQILFERITNYYHVNSIHDIWPNLSIFVHGGVSIQPYKISIDKYCAKPLIYMDTYMASEGFMAYQERPNEGQSMKLITDNSIFFEFVPFNDSNFDTHGNIKLNAKAIDLSLVKLDTDYALLISNCAGAWRYLIGDTIKFTDLSRNEIIISGRTKHFLNFCGEHLSVDNMNKAILMASKDLNFVCNEYCVFGKVYSGFFAHYWFIGSDSEIDLQLLKKQLDLHLKQLNDDYATERLHALKDIFIKVVPNKLFIDFLASKNKLGGQSKISRVLNTKQLNEWNNFLEFNNITCF